MQKNYNYVFKFVIIGSSSVGKSSILRRFADDEFEESYISTIGIDFRFKSLFIDENYLKLQIWDTAGQQRFRGITKSYYKGANAVILVYDITNPKTFEDITSYWIKQTKQYAEDQHIFCFVNKCDAGEETEIPEEQIRFLEENGIVYYKVSAKKRINVNESILDIARKMMKAYPKNINPTNNLGLRQINNHQPAKKCCK